MLSKITINAGGVMRDFHYRKGSSDQATVAQIFFDRHYDMSGLRCYPDIQSTLANGHCAGRRPLVIDAGANIGAASVFFAFTVPGCVVAAVEPDSGNHELLLRNTAGLDVKPFLAGIASKPGMLTIMNELGQNDSFRTRPADGGQADQICIPAITGAQILNGFDDSVYPFIAKIDIEGAEEDLFSSNIEWIDQFPIIIIELHDWLFPYQNISLPFLRWAAKGDRDIIVKGENLFAISNRIAGSRG
jgi:FkbM family methyltransferase